MDTRKKVSFSLPPEVIEGLKQAAAKDGRNASRYLEAVLVQWLGLKPKPPAPPKRPAAAKKKKDWQPGDPEAWNKMHDPVNFD